MKLVNAICGNKPKRYTVSRDVGHRLTFSGTLYSLERRRRLATSLPPTVPRNYGYDSLIVVATSGSRTPTFKTQVGPLSQRGRAMLRVCL